MRRILLPSLVISVQIGCLGDRAKTESEPLAATETQAVSEQVVSFTEDPELQGLRMTLREAKPPRTSSESLPTPKATRLTDADADALFAGVPALEPDGFDKQPFALRKASDPPPITGDTVKESFPPSATLPAPIVETGALSVIRHTPDGEVPMAPHLSVTFSQPMVAVTSQEQAAKTVPVTLEPQPAGEWRWLGTKTLMFDPDPRFPMATEYSVTVPSGTTSATGSKLEKAFTFTFATPAPILLSSYPSDGPMGLDPVISLQFDQAMDAKSVLAHTKLTAPSLQPSLRLATDAEILEDATAKYARNSDTPERWVFLKATEKLQKATYYSFSVSEGTPSAEGPRVTTGDQGEGFYTYTPLEVAEYRCNWGDACPPTSGWYVRMNNPLDLNAFDPASIKVEPAVPGLNINVYGDTLNFYGQMAGRTQYTVVLPSGLKDAFGQTLGKDKTLQFTTGPAEKTLSLDGEFQVLDPEGSPKLPVHSTNHASLRVKIQRVSPTDWAPWSAFLQKFNYDDRTPGKMPGKNVFDGTIKVTGTPDSNVETGIDLTPYLQGGTGQFAVWIEPTNQPADKWSRQYAWTWVQVTHIGLTAFADNHNLTVWTSDLADGHNLNGVNLSLLPNLPTPSVGVSGTDGLGRIVLPESSPTNDPQVLVATSGTDTAILPYEPSYWSSYGGWLNSADFDELRWYMFDDRGLYRPGETVKLKGWLRSVGSGVGGDVNALNPGPSKVSWTLYSSMRNELGKGETTVAGLGGFEIEIAIPDNANLGTAYLELAATDGGSPGGYYTHPIEIQEFRRPEFEVTAVPDASTHILGTEATVTVNANYFAGGALPNADVYWNVYANQSSYSPPNQTGFSFGSWSPWWWGGWDRGGWGSEGQSSPPVSLQGKTDGAGQHTLGIKFEAMNPARPYTVRAEAQVYDVNRQAWTATSSFIVHPSDVYVGLKNEKAFVERGQDVVVHAIAANIDGKRLSGQTIDIQFSRLEWGYKKGSWSESPVDSVACPIVSSEKEQDCTFKPTIGGSYKILATTLDEHGRRNETEVRVWVSGSDEPPSRGVSQQQVTLIPEGETYQPGDVAHVLLQAPFFPAEGVMTVQRSGLVTREVFHLDSATKTFDIPVREDYIPNFSVQFDIVGKATRYDDDGKRRDDLPKQVAFAAGTLTFQVPPKGRTLTVVVTPRDKTTLPGGQTSLDLVVTDALGKPVPNAELAVVVVDEAVLSLTDYHLPNPLDVFYSARPGGVSTHHLRSYVTLANPIGLPAVAPSGSLGGLGMRGTGIGGGGYGGVVAQGDALSSGAAMGIVAAAPAEPMMAIEKSSKAKPDMDKDMEFKRSREEGGEAQSQPSPPTVGVALRTDFSALALFAPDVTTDAAGRAVVPVKLPDSLTRYRVMVVAVAGGKQFGSGEADITAQLPLMVRPSPPRFLNFGDQFELPIVVQNQTDAPMTVDVGVRATNVTLVDAIGALKPDPNAPRIGKAARRVTVPAHDRVEVRFPAVTQMAGTARFQAVAAAGKSTDAANFELPVWTPATTEAFATYGEIDNGVIAQPVEAPPDVWPQFGGLEVTTSSTQLQALTDAVLYLQQYPFDCNEQIASRVLAIASLRDVLTAFESKDLPPPAELERTVDTDLKKLASRQNWDGGFSWWRRGDESWPMLGIHVAHAEARAKAKGYEVPSDMWARSQSYLQNIEQYIPSWYSQESKWFLRAYAVYVRNRMGDNDVKKAKALYKEAGIRGLGIDALGMLLPVLDAGKATVERDEIIRHLENNTSETAGEAHFVTSYSDGDQTLLHSDRRADGIILESMIEVAPKSDLIPKVVRGLLAHRVRGKWSNTQDNAFVLLALDRYFRVYEAQTPDFVARVWLGADYAGDHTFKGRTTERSLIEIPMGQLTETQGSQPLTVQKDGAGRLYYRIGMKYAPTNLNLEPADYGFAVERRYEAIDDPKDVRRTEDGVWHIKAGASVRVRVTMVAEGRRYHVALVDPLPAGFEAQNPELATTGTLPLDPGSTSQPYWWWWQRTWYEHENMRDERVEAFTSLLWDGVHEYVYIARATTPGHFVVPPAKAEEMYAPETFGRSATDQVIVEEGT